MKGAIVIAGLGCLCACSAPKPTGPALPPVTMISPDSANHIGARFSPDGSRLFWWEPAGLGNQLWTADARLGNPTKVPVTALQVTGLLWSPDGSQIAVPSSTSGYVQVAVIPAAGGMPRALTDVSFAIAFGWHPDGDRLTYAAYTGPTFRAYVTSASHGGPKLLVPSETKPAVGLWSPDGANVVYTQLDGSRSTIWAADRFGGNPRQLTTDGFERFGNTEWVLSPDGKMTAYESRRTGTSDIWVVPIAGGAPTQLTHDIRNDYSPIWSPDGKWIAFISERGKQTDVWVVPAAGGQEIRVTDDASVEELMQWVDGNHLALLTGQGQSGIWTMNLADSTEHRLTPDSIRATQSNPSPDGKQVVFRLERGGGNSDLAVMPTGGGPMRTLVQGGDNTSTTWSPDGSKLAFTSDRGGTQDIWIVDVAGGEPRQLENWPGAESSPRWSGDGRTIYFVADRETQLGDIWQVAVAGGAPTRLTNHGSVSGVTTHHGRPEVLAAIVGPTGALATVLLKPDGTFVPVANGKDAIPIDLLPGTDSVVLADVGKGGRISYRIIQLAGGGEGRPLLKAGEALSNRPDNWDWVAYEMPNGGTQEIGLLDRKTGATRRLTQNSFNEGFASVTADGKTLVFTRSRAVRRIAIADLSQLLAKAAGTPH